MVVLRPQPSLSTSEQLTPLALRDFQKPASTVELTFLAIGGVNSGFGGRQSEDQPAAAGVHGTKAKNVAEKGPVCLRVVAVEEDVCSGDARKHGPSLTSDGIHDKECF
jgi:hypothetical protein